MFRVPIFFALLLGYFAILQWLPIGSLGKKAVLWCIIGTPGIWWIDLQIDGVKRGCEFVSSVFQSLADDK
jgi:1-acylglycerol-3-phosphate O-acyltransferase